MGKICLDLMHTILSVRICVETPSIRGVATTIRQRGQSRPCKSFTTFHVQSNRHVFQSKVHVASKQRLCIPNIHRGIIKLCFTRKNFPSDLLLVGCGNPRSHGRNARLGNSQSGSCKTRVLHSLRIRALDLIGHFHYDVFNQDKFLINEIEVRMQLVHSEVSFRFMEAKSISKIRILDASLIVRRAKNKPRCTIRLCADVE